MDRSPDDEPIHVTIPGSPADPRNLDPPEGVIVHYVPELHPDDFTIVDGLRVASVARTLVDLAEEMPEDELRAVFGRAREIGVLDIDAVRASRARVEWRPSLAVLDEVIAKFG